MIQIAGATRLFFAFPASPETAFHYYSGLVDRLADFLPHIERVQVHAPRQFRMCYQATELGAYDVRMFCDVVVDRDPGSLTLTVRPETVSLPLPNRASLYATTGPALYFSQSIFRPDGDQTQVEYSLDLRAQLPVPHSLRIMPVRVVDGIANAITERRIREIAAGFIAGSRAHFAGGGEKGCGWLGAIAPTQP